MYLFPRRASLNGMGLKERSLQEVKIDFHANQGKKQNHNRCLIYSSILYKGNLG
jgi:hypothetical protein